MSDPIDPRLEGDENYHRQQANLERAQLLQSQGWGVVQAGLQAQLDSQNQRLGRPLTLLSSVQHSGIDGNGTPPDPSLGYVAGDAPPDAAAGEQGAPATFEAQSAGSLGEYLTRYAQDGVTDHWVRATVRGDRRVHISVQPAKVNHSPADYVVDGNTISPLRS